MGTYLRLTPALRAVLTCFLESDDALWGLLISARSGKPTGTIYPLLERLERAGFIASFWEGDAGHRGPRRRLYSLLPEGRLWAEERLGR
ncbi:PadR family transcriptional regulator [Sinomonas sp. ASV322]|uniref:PadR family transcriptional regulator n=1 Tax=Sinomonas sp. ASV322 TaxID=3041920 RepID=UPI0035A277DD